MIRQKITPLIASFSIFPYFSLTSLPLYSLDSEHYPAAYGMQRWRKGRKESERKEGAFEQALWCISILFFVLYQCICLSFAS